MNDSKKLVVDLLRLFDLQAKEIDLNSSKEIFCKCSLMPDKFYFQTKLAKMATDLVFDEQFEFTNLELSYLDTCYLDIGIFEYSKQSKAQYLGSSLIKLNYSNIETKKILTKNLKFEAKRNEVNQEFKQNFLLNY